MIISLLLTSVIGLVLYLVCSYLFYISESNAKAILLGITSIIPIVGAAFFLLKLINGVLYHTHPLNNETSLGYKSMWFDESLKVKDTKLNCWLFNDIPWDVYDIMKNECNKLNKS